ncbi:DUF1918 domain-containing protein [Streptomyces rubellomurinus]|uniref:DUF1918 domain-containing protein n=2 Tax=Streptomyces TaxID=1883 RepID=A0A0F2TDK2_STRR3|nr:DUF1918 domain-containing protein [Streptomyces rubellomurinus]KJS52666.1 hypothetical protein VM98_29955 [Streptomyces rubellomurinus subsp. indigoferus]KJS59827.1 hypothetical protein VM95_24995 [Streptomyces rubellomurinus]
MHAAVGDQLHIHSSRVGMVDQKGIITEVRGPNGEPPYLVRFEDGHRGLVYPGPDCNIEHTGEKASR